MINVSDAFRAELNNGNRIYYAFLNIVLADGTALNLTNEHLWGGGLKLEESVSDSSDFSIGSAIASKLTITLNNAYGDFTDYIFDDAIVTVQLGIKLPNGTIERVNKGIYTVTEASGQNSSLVTLECLDKMFKFNKPYSDIGTVYPATLATILNDVCTACGVTLSTTAFPNSSYQVVNRPADDALSCMDVVSYVAQIACCWAKINTNGQLVLNWYNTAPIQVYEKLITKSASDFIQTKSGDFLCAIGEATDEEIISGDDIYTVVHKIQHTNSHTVALDDVVITGLQVVVKREDETIKALEGTTGYILSIEDNPFINEGSEGTVASLVGERCIGMSFRPLEVSCLSDPTIEAGDRIYFISPIDNKVYRSYVTSYTFGIDDYEKISCDAEPPARNSATKYSAVTKSYVELRSIIQKEKSAYEAGIEELSERIDAAGGFYITEEEQPDGSIITYQHDKPTLEESTRIWKETADTRSVSTDGGRTWNAGITADGEAVVKHLAAEGINADWINAGTFVVYDSQGNVIFSASKDTKQVLISSDGVTIKGYSGVASQSLTQAINGAINTYKVVVDGQIADLQAQLDGHIDSWYENYDPTLSNLPASEWTTEELKQEHEGDTFTNLSTGVSYRFVKDNNVWQWQVITDTAATQALALAGEALAAADGKIRHFVTTPVPPYDEGDLWTNSSTGKLYVCVNTKTSQQAYASADWEERVGYTDDTRANQAYALAESARALNVVLTNDYDSIPTDANGHYTTFPSGIQTTVQAFYGHTNISGSCTYTVTKSSGVTGTWSSNTRTYTVTGLSTDSGWVDIQATYLNSITATKRYTISKNKQGVTGQTGATGAQGPAGAAGAPGRVYTVEPSVNSMTRENNNSITPMSVTFHGYYSDGGSARQTYQGRFKIEESTDGNTWTTVYQSSANETSCEYISRAFLMRKGGSDYLITRTGAYLLGANTTANMVRCTMYAAGGVTNVLDQQSVPIVSEGAGLVLILTNETVSVTAENNGGIPDYSQCYTYIQAFYGKINVTDLCTYSVSVSSGLTGSWDSTAKRYKVNGLTVDNGYADITVSYKGITAVRRFTVSKSKEGTEASRFYLELSTKNLKISTNNVYVPSSVTINLKQTNGNTDTSSLYVGRLKVVEWKNGIATTRRAVNAGTLQTYTYTPSQTLLDYVVIEMYDYSGTTILDKETIQCMIDVEALTGEDVLGILSDGTYQGIYTDGAGHFYIGCSMLKGEELVLGGANNANGTFALKDSSNNTVITMNNGGITLNAGSINLSNKFIVSSSGALTAKSGTIGNIHVTENSIYSGSKSSYNNNNQGFFLGSDGKFGLGTNSTGITWDGSTLSLKVSSLTIGGATAATQTYANTQASSAENNAKSYAASQASSAESNAKTYAASQASSAESNAKTYADGVGANAAKTASNYLNWSSGTGLVISEDAASSGKHVLINSNGIYLKSGSTVSASFDSDGLNLGGESDGYGKISVYSSNNRQIMCVDSNGLVISSDGNWGTESLSLKDGIITGILKENYTEETYGVIDLIAQVGTGSSKYLTITANNCDGILLNGNVNVRIGTFTAEQQSIFDGVTTFKKNVVFEENPNPTTLTRRSITYNRRNIYYTDLQTAGAPTYYLGLNSDNRLSKVEISSGSSIRYKDVYGSLTSDNWKGFYNVKPVLASYKEGHLPEDHKWNGVKMPMLIAEEIEKVFPNAVKYTGDGLVDDYDYHLLASVHQGMIIEQKERNDIQDKEIRRLKAEIEELKKLLN